MSTDAEELITNLLELPGFATRTEGDLTILVDHSVGQQGPEYEIRRSRKQWHVVRKRGTTDMVAIPPRFGHGYRRQNLLSDLERLGLPIRTKVGPPKKKRKKNPLGTCAPHPSAPPTPPSARSPEPVPEEPMPTNTVQEIIQDEESMAFATDLLLEQVNRLARRDKARSRVQRGERFWEWHGDLFEVARDIWPDLPDARNHPDWIALQTSLVPFMRERHAFFFQVGPQRRGSNTWWLVKDDGKSDLPEDHAPAAEPQALPPAPPEPEQRAQAEPEQPPPPTPALSVTFSDVEPPPALTPPADTTNQPETEPDVKYHKCEHCPYTAKSAQAITMHNTRTVGPHPQEAFPCPHCPAVLVTEHSYAIHLPKEHHELYGGKVVCHKCMQAHLQRGEGEPEVKHWFDDGAEIRKHRYAEHRESFSRRRTASPVPVPAPRAAVPAQRVRAVAAAPAPHAITVPAPQRLAPAAPTSPAVNGVATNGDLRAAARDEAIRMITEHPLLEQRVRDLERQLAEETELRRAAEKKLAKFKRLAELA